MATAARNRGAPVPVGMTTTAESAAPLHLAAHVVKGLAGVIRDHEGAGKSTYTWLYKLEKPDAPGESPLAEIAIRGADGMGKDWTRARDKLNEVIKRLEPRGKLVTEHDFQQAIRRARPKPASDA